ncbi:hypothetical protein FA13DRAFT_1792074 [Coprinellus micaceus]|uniref:Nephrocystin 3-like N-terminal domain-containing protein n=1 Tax=Coprinellus micaceus TaxID=71717 RepID=A0A4Y7T9W3_COPMI|nr:hypothetical protein FA13DRAFT_1792074 [Coprinellus micaceus]
MASRLGPSTWISTITTATFRVPCYLPPDPMQLLRDARAVEATHTSKTAAYAPKCRPGSRAKVIQDIMDWITTDSARISPASTTTSILWFHGPAGGGKTCIMREVVSRCEKLGLLTASHFFSTRVAGLDNETPFVATIASQFATTADMRMHMSQAILERPDIINQSLDFQSEKLLSPCTPTSGPVGEPALRWKIIVVDGFDECRKHAEHGDASTRSRHQDLIRVLTYRTITHILRLQDYDGTSEIRDYFCDEFRDIRETHPTRDSIPLDWPIEDILEPLVDKSSGSYIYPSTVIRYVRNPRRNPVALLREVLSLVVTNSNPLAELHALYHHILHPPEVDILVLKRLLHCIRSMTGIGSLHRPVLGSHPHLIPSLLDGLFALPAGTACTTLCDLHSLVAVPTGDDSGPLRFHHKSLEDYLCTSERSGDLHQTAEETQKDITLACLSYLRDWPNKFGLGSEVTAGHRSMALNFVVDYWTAYLCLRTNWDTTNSSSLLRASIADFDPAILWTIELLSPRDPATWGMNLEMRAIQTALHLMCGQGLTNGGCIPICRRASQLLEIADTAERFRKRNASPETQDRLIGASGNGIEDLLTRFDAEVLSLVPYVRPASPPYDTLVRPSLPPSATLASKLKRLFGLRRVASAPPAIKTSSQ